MFSKENSIKVTVLFLVGLFLLAIPNCTWAADEEEAKGFIRSVAATVYGLAWPTATYEDFSFKSMDPVTGGYDIKVRLSGTSSFSGGDLWMEIVLELRNGTLNDVRVNRHNALLAPPFATSQAVGELIVELADESFGGQQQQPSHFSSSSSSASSGYPFYVRNNCRHSIRIALRYRHVSGDWRTGAWWEFSGGESSYLASGGAKILTSNSIFYYYAETEDGRLHWSGNALNVQVGGRNLTMAEMRDDEGDSEITLTCPGQ